MCALPSDLAHAADRPAVDVVTTVAVDRHLTHQAARRGVAVAFLAAAGSWVAYIVLALLVGSRR